MFTVDPTLAFTVFQGLSGSFRYFWDFQLLKLKYDKLLSSFAFNFNLRHYNWESAPLEGFEAAFIKVGRCRLTPS